MIKSIGDFRVAFRLCFKASPSAKPFIWKLVLFTHKFWFPYERLCTWTCFENRGERQLGNHLLKCDPIVPERGEVGGHWWGAGDTGPSKNYYWLFFVFFSIATTQERKRVFSTPSVVQ